MAVLQKRAHREKRRKRVRRKIAGTAERPRLSVYRSNVNIYAQLVDDDAGLITGALEFSEYTAADVMVPLERLVLLKTSATPLEFEKAVSRTGFSRFPMVDDDGMLAGYLHIKDVLSIPESGYGHPIAESRIRSLANLPRNAEIENAMSVMQRTGSHLARVIGSDGQTDGVLFLEDVIEQLVGEIRDATQARGIRRLGAQNGE